MTTTDGTVQPSRLRVGAAAAVVLVAVVGAPAAHGLQAINGSFDPSSLATTGLIFALLGALVMIRQPTNPLGVVLAAIGGLSVLGAMSEAVTTVTYGSERLQVPGAVWAGWFGDWYWLPTIWLQFVAIPLLFPDGRPNGDRWRRYGLVAAVGASVCVVMAMGSREIVLDGVQLGLSGESTVTIALDNPAGVLPLGNFERDAAAMMLLLPIFALGAVVSMVQRFRGATVDVRRQLKVVVTAIAVGVVGFALFAGLDASRVPVVDLLELPLLLLIPVSLGVAILRYRLYDIDRVVSRTVAWTTASLVLASLYLGVVVGLQAVLRPVLGTGDLPVAVATLAVAAVARPLLRRVQALVDQRFNRARVDAARTIAAFGRSLRDEVSRDAIVADLRDVAQGTFQPSTVGVHLVAVTTEGASP